MSEKNQTVLKEEKRDETALGFGDFCSFLIHPSGKYNDLLIILGFSQTGYRNFIFTEWTQQ